MVVACLALTSRTEQWRLFVACRVGGVCGINDGGSSDEAPSAAQGMLHHVISS